MLLALVGLSIPAAASAEPGATQQCVAAYEAGQKQRKAADFVAARASLLLCSSPACPRVMHPDCQRWLASVEASLPTVVFRAMTSAGVVLSGAQLSLDDAPMQGLDGRAIPLNPGRHSVRVTHPEHGTTNAEVLVFEGKKLERHDVALPAPLLSPERRARPVARSESSVARIPPGLSSSAGSSSLVTSASARDRAEPLDLTLPLLASGVAGVAGAVGFGYFGLQARKGDRGLGDCTPNCGDGTIADVKSDYRLANVSLGVGLVGLVTFGVLFLLDGSAVTPDSHAGRAASALRAGRSPHWTLRF